MPSFALQLTNARHDTLVLHRTLPLRGALITEGTVVWVPVYALLHREHRTQEPLIVRLPFDRLHGRVVMGPSGERRRERLRLRFNHGPASQRRGGAYPGHDQPAEEIWDVAHLALSETRDLAKLEQVLRRRLRWHRFLAWRFGWRPTQTTNVESQT